jgi:hypothetical protein
MDIVLLEGLRTKTEANAASCGLLIEALMKPG